MHSHIDGHLAVMWTPSREGARSCTPPNGCEHGETHRTSQHTSQHVERTRRAPPPHADHLTRIETNPPTTRPLSLSPSLSPSPSAQVGRCGRDRTEYLLPLLRAERPDHWSHPARRRRAAHDLMPSACRCARMAPYDLMTPGPGVACGSWTQPPIVYLIGGSTAGRVAGCLRSGCAVCRECGCGYTVTSDGGTGAYFYIYIPKAPCPRPFPVRPGDVSGVWRQLTRDRIAVVAAPGELKHPRTPDPAPPAARGPRGRPSGTRSSSMGAHRERSLCSLALGLRSS